MSPLAIGIIAVFVIQWAIFIPSFLMKTERFFDLTGAATYIGVTAYLATASGNLDERTRLLAIVVGIWAARLGMFLFRRVMRSGSDSRFDAIKVNGPRFFVTWTVQGVWITLTASAAWVAISVGERVDYDVWALIGSLLWIVGFGIEVQADKQKRQFKAAPENEGRFIRTGLWRISRHPNYFGEILLWIGVLVIAIPTFRGWMWLGVVSPVFVALLITRVSGLPMLEAKAKKTWGGDEDYEAYVASTPVLVPFIGRKRNG